jgi:hypothetical protein
MKKTDLTEEKLREFKAAANLGRKIAHARKRRRQAMVNFWYETTGKSSIDHMTANTIYGYVLEHGEATVYPWIEAAARAPCAGNDRAMGQYISGIRRSIAKAQRYAGDMNQRQTPGKKEA